MTDSLDALVADGIIDEVLSRLKSGKEADIYLVQHGGEVLAAKVYKEREFRSFQNNAAYKEGRSVRNTRTQRAMQKGSRFGRDADEDAWKTKESDAIQTLFAAGVRVPKPHLFYEGVLLMEVVVDADGRPAPRLIDARIADEQAAELYADIRRQMVTLLTCDLIHGDLSPYNVLMAWNGPTLIDFPQVVGAAHNSQAEHFFRRDLETIRQFFAAKAPALHDRAGDAQEIWRAYSRRELTPDFVPKLVPQNRAHHHRGPPRAPQGQPHAAKHAAGHRPHGQGERGRRDQKAKPQGHVPPAQRPPQPGRAQPSAAQRPGPAVSYVGQPVPPAGGASTPAQPGPKRRRRRRRGRRGQGPPPS